jgi:VanZ family protein
MSLKKVGPLLNAYLPPMLWAGLIFFLSAQSTLPSFDVSFYDFIFKKLSHIFVYGVLYFLIYRGLGFQKMDKKQRWWVAFLFCAFYASMDEVHQWFTPNRSPTIRDVGYDLLGASIAFLKLYSYI